MTDSDKRLASVCWTIAATLCCSLCFLQLGAMMSLAAGHAGFRFVAPISLLASLLAGSWLMRREQLPQRLQVLSLGIALGIVLLSLAVSLFYFDLSWDGQWYHQTAILHIADNWNPMADPLHTFASHLRFWVRHYPKGPWYASAAIFKATGHIEAGKCVQWIALAAMFFAVFAALLEIGLRRAAAFAMATLMALNPVVTSQLTGFMVDGIMVSSLAVAVAATISALRSPRRITVAVAASAAIVAINTKFTGLVFLCFALVAAGLWCLVCRREMFKRFAVTAIATLAIAVCFFGYNPYITNTVHMHQPLYPALGSAKYPPIDHIEAGETPRNMRGHNRFFRLGYAVFGRPGNQPYYIGKNATLMWPFAARPADLYAYTYQETRLAGFGPWFSGCLILALALAVWLIAQRTPGRWTLLLVFVTIAASLLISRHLWWPRYGPQLWWVPVASLIVALRSDCTRNQQRAAWALTGLLLMNALIVAGVRMQWETAHSMALRQQLHDMHDSGKTFRVSTQYFSDSAEEKLAEAGIRFQNVGMMKLPAGSEMVSVVEHYPAAIRYQPVEDGR